MSQHGDPALEDYYRAAETWAEDRREGGERSRKIAWIVAGLAGAIALVEAVALVLLLPLKQVEPVAVLVDKQTGFVQQLNLTEGQTILPDKALVQSMLAQYVSAREGFNTAALREDYRKVALWSSGSARSQYIAGMQASNPLSPLATLPRSAVVAVEIRSISPLSADSALVRFATARTDQSGNPQPQGTWAAVIRYRFTSAQMSAESRLVNPLGFQVLSYTKSAEIPPAMAQTVPLPLPANQPLSVVTTPIGSGPTQAPLPR